MAGKQQLLGFRRNGCPIWLVQGGDGTDSESATDVERDADVNVDVAVGKQDSAESAETEPDWKAEAERWKNLSRKHEDRAKTNAAAAKERDELKRAQMGDQEKAVAEAKDQARAEALREAAPRILAAEFRAAAAGRQVNGKPLDTAALLDGLDAGRYLTDAGEVDIDKVTKFLDSIAPQPDPDEARSRRFPDLGQGKRAPAEPEVKPGMARLRYAYQDTKTK